MSFTQRIGTTFVVLGMAMQIVTPVMAQELQPQQSVVQPTPSVESLLRGMGVVPSVAVPAPGMGNVYRSVVMPSRSSAGLSRSGALTLSSGASTPVNMSIGSARTLILPGEFDRATLVLPEVAEIIALSKNRVQVMARQAGSTDMVFTNTATGASFRAHITVGLDASPVQSAISGALPREKITATSIGGSIVLGGSTRDAATAAQATAIARRFVTDPLNGVINNIQVLGAQQVLLQVRVAEVSRNVVRQFGMNSAVRFGNSVVGNANLSTSTSTTGGKLSIGGAGFDTLATVANPVGYLSTKVLGGLLNTTLNALESDGLVRLLAEPNLTTMSGQTANFLAGQQYPIPVVGLNGTGGTEYRNFGVQLAFTPTVLSSNNISLQIMTELSTKADSVGIPSGGVVAQVPIFNVRRATTTVEMPSGGSIAIAGLIQSDFQNSLSGFPGIRNIPILGRLFSSTDFQRRESELVIIVTPYLVESSDPSNHLSAPTDGLIPPTDLDLYFMSRLTGANSRRGTSASVPASVARNVGFITE